MKRETWRTWILVGVVAMLGAGALAEQARERRRAPKPMMQIERSETTSIERRCASGCVRLVLLKRQGAWELTEPWFAPADADKIEQLTAIAAAPLKQRWEREALIPADIGLEPPFASLKLGPRLIEFGDAVPGHQTRYVRVGSMLGLVQDRFSALLTGPPESFVDPRPLAGVVPVSGSHLGQPMSAAALEGWRKLVARRIDPLPQVFPGHNLEFRTANGKPIVVMFDLRGDEVALWRRDVRALYIIDAAQFAALGGGGA